MSAASVTGETHKKKSGKLGKIFLGFVALMVVLYLVVQIGLNSLINYKLQSTYGEVVRYDSLKLGIIRGQLTLENLSIADPEQEDPALKIDRLHAKGMWKTLLSGAPIVTELEIGDVEMLVEKRDGQTNWELLQERLDEIKDSQSDSNDDQESQSKDDEKSEDKDDTPTIIESLNINRIQITFRNQDDDDMQEGVMTFNGITASNVGSEDGSENRFALKDFSLTSNQQELLNISGILVQYSEYINKGQKFKTLQNLEIESPEIFLRYNEDGDSNLDAFRDLIGEFQDDEQDSEEDDNGEDDGDEEDKTDDIFTLQTANWSNGKLHLEIPTLDGQGAEKLEFTHAFQATGDSIGGVSYKLTLEHDESESVFQAYQLDDVFEGDESGEFELSFEFDRFPYYAITRIIDHDLADGTPRLKSANLNGVFNVRILADGGRGSYQISYSDVQTTEDKRTFLQRMLPGGMALRLKELADENGNTPTVSAKWDADWDHPNPLVIFAEFQKAGLQNRLSESQRNINLDLESLKTENAN